MLDRCFHFLARLSLVAALGPIGLAVAQDQPPPQPTFPTLPADTPAGSGMMQPCLEELEGR
ncbi:MAG: hypothetical protein O7A04_03640, partial [Acidobacteria bacterium]|nr:hypothetical protein [Acidobacteriota bacterium]